MIYLLYQLITIKMDKSHTFAETELDVDERIWLYNLYKNSICKSPVEWHK